MDGHTEELLGRRVVNGRMVGWEDGCTVVKHRGQLGEKNMAEWEE